MKNDKATDDAPNWEVTPALVEFESRLANNYKNNLIGIKELFGRLISLGWGDTIAPTTHSRVLLEEFISGEGSIRYRDAADSIFQGIATDKPSMKLLLDTQLLLAYPLLVIDSLELQNDYFRELRNGLESIKKALIENPIANEAISDRFSNITEAKTASLDSLLADLIGQLDFIEKFRAQTLSVILDKRQINSGRPRAIKSMITLSLWQSLRSFDASMRAAANMLARFFIQSGIELRSEKKLTESIYQRIRNYEQIR
ncbi:hypothetical protein [Salinisphaera sp. LB1]|uniref:hypothetical protein n=1 Tax=Salinisphaera sp. LB1 TaxID=2183911 RepID=UPI000D70664C|nr:hypothetical protein [Salinisphaera sp. LB1]